MESGYEESLAVSTYLKQFKCKCSKKRWWGTLKNSNCNKCHAKATPLQLKQMIGIGCLKSVIF